ncbi:MAG: hypothetical protein R6U98_22065, partial [Pirellulaceae bacterium]
LIRSIPDFPKPGIIFRDITTLTADAEALRDVTRALAMTRGGESHPRPVYFAQYDGPRGPSGGMKEKPVVFSVSATDWAVRRAC